MRIQLSAVRIDGDTQQRQAIDQRHVDDIAAALQAGEKVAPVRTMFDGSAQWLYDGFHRYFAHQKRGLKTLDAEVTNGTAEDARRESYRAWNAKHGLKESREDKERRVRRAVGDPLFAKWSDRKLGEHLDVDHKTVARYRTDGERVQKVGNSPTASTISKEPEASDDSETWGDGTPVADAPAAPESPPPMPVARPEKPKDAAQKPAVELDAPKDGTGRPIPEWLRAAFAGKSTLLELAGEAFGIARQMKEFCLVQKGGAFIDLQDVKARCDGLAFIIKRDMPYAVCRLCGGRKGGCDACDKQGWLPKERYEATTPKELKDPPPPPGGKGRAA